MASAREPLDTVAVADLIGVSPLTLRQWRHRGAGPRWYRAGNKLVRYRRASVDEWLAAREMAPVDARPAA